MLTAIGLVAAGLGITLVLASVRRLHRDESGDIPPSDKQVVSPIVIGYRADDRMPLLAPVQETAAQRA
ncbi:hypothetical protein [Pseudomonas oryzihabitans]|uniref:hypothetical protein n=1 Tax=Pseudomonas oryzihabitans TaxID=47885 RepID=UPI0039175A46